MNTPQVKVQIPLTKPLRDAIEQHALALGFNSVQDFTRVLYTAVLREDLQASFVPAASTVRMSKEAEARYAQQLKTLPERLKSGEAKRFANHQEAKAFLANL